MAYPTKFNYSQAKSHKFSLAMVRIILDRLLANQENNLYPRIEATLGEPGKTGRPSWDACFSTQYVLEADADITAGGTGELNDMVQHGSLTLPTIHAELVKVLRSANFTIERGRITGVVEQVEDHVA